VTYPGGKGGSGVYQAIINLMPPHRVYVEPFLGGGSILKLKRPAIASIGVDSDDDVVNAWLSQPPIQSGAGCTVIHGDGISFLRGYDWRGDELVYCDPPYLMETRSCQRPLYRHEMTTDDHQRLLTVIRSIPAMVMISGYYSGLYAEALADWRTARFTTTTRGGNIAEEWVWMNFRPPLELHDYRYLGRNFRERERIKRKKLRWLNRLYRMDSLERQAIMMAIGEFRDIIAGNGDTDVGTITSDVAREAPEMAIAAAIGADGDEGLPLHK